MIMEDRGGGYDNIQVSHLGFYVIKYPSIYFFLLGVFDLFMHVLISLV